MNDGKITDARDQVFTTFFSFFLFICSMRPSRRGSMNGPFLIDRDMSSPSPLLPAPRADDQCVRARSSRPVAHRRGTPRRLRRHAGRGLALAAAVRMVPRVHHDAPDLRSLAHVAGAAGLAEVLVLVVQVADLADGGHASDADLADLARGQADLGVLALLGQQLRRGARRTDDLAALARDELQVVDGRAQRDVCDRQGVADPSLGAGAGQHDVADAQAVGQEHVPLLAVPVVEQPDPGRTVRVVLDRGDSRGHAVLVALEVDPPVVGLLAAAAMAHGEPALVVPAGGALLRLEQRLVRLGGGDLLERRAGHPATSGRGRLVAPQGHRYTPSKNWIFWPGARVTTALRQGEVVPTMRPRRVPRDFSLALVVSKFTETTVTLSVAYSSSMACLIWILFAFGW